MCRANGAKNKLSTIDRSTSILDHEDLNNVVWKMYNQMVHSWLINYVSILIA